MRSLAPSDSLIYLETNDLGAALQPIVDSKAFGEAAQSKPDLSATKGVQLAIAVTGFETIENKISDENSELNFKPHFVAIADTHAWQWQARSFAENQLGEFINKIYGGGVQLDTSAKDGGTSYVWTAEDGRKAYGFVTGSLIFFGNDESSIDKVQAVRRGEADPISKNDKLPHGKDTLAVAYVSTDGIAQISNIIGAQKAKESGEESETQSFIARVLPQLLRGSIKDAVWEARKSETGMEDTVTLSLQPGVADVLNETFAPADKFDDSLLAFAPSDALAVTQYNIKDPQKAWRNVLLLTQKLTDPVSGKLLTAFSNSFFEPYGIKDGDIFLGSSSQGIVTVKYEDDDSVAVITKTTDPKLRKNSLDPEFAKSGGANVELTDPSFQGVTLSGDAATVQKCIQAQQIGQNLRAAQQLRSTAESIPVARTIGLDRDTALLLAEVLNEKKSDSVQPSRYLVETRLSKSGLERRLVSEFGLIGSIVAMLGSEE